MSAEPQITISEEYDASLFTSSEYKCRLESKTKFILIELEGSNLCIRSGKLPAEGTFEQIEETKLKKFPSHDAALADLIKEFKAKKKAYPIKDDSGLKKLSELELPSSKRGAKGKKKEGDEAEDASADASTDKESAVSVEEVGEKRKCTSDVKSDLESEESDAKKQKIDNSKEEYVSTPVPAAAAVQPVEPLNMDNKTKEMTDKQQFNGDKTEEKTMEEVAEQQ